MTIIVLGGHGFVGSAVVHLLETLGYNPIPISRRDDIDLRDLTATRNMMRDYCPEVIINCASHGGSLHYVTECAADVVHDNIQIILNLYLALKDTVPGALVINPISNCSYPGSAGVQCESEWLDGPVHESVWSFANAKRLWVVVSQCYARQYGVRTINLIAPNTYGPGDNVDPNKTHALNGMIIRMLKAKWDKEQQFVIWGSGSPVREWIYVDDFARALTEAVGDNSRVEPINIAQHQGYSIRETAEMIQVATGFTGELTFDTSYADGAPVKILDDAIFRGQYPEFRFIGMQEGILRTVEYYERILQNDLTP